MTSLRDRLHLLADRGEHRPIDDVIHSLRRDRHALEAPTPTMTTNTEDANMIDLAPASPSGLGNRSGRHVAFVAAVALLVGLIGAAAINATRSANTAVDVPPAAQPASQPIAPELTLPPVDDPGVPMTAFSPDPDYSYRLTPDVEIGWNAVNGGDVQFCWRTPVVKDCGGEPAPGTDPIAVSVAPGQVVAIVAVRSDFSKASAVQFALDDGSIVEAPIEWTDDPITIGSARADIQAERIVSTITTT